MAREHGFTLVELVLVMVVVSVGLLGMARLFADSSKSLIANEEGQKVAQYAQECGERVLRLRKASGYANVTTSACGTAPSGVTWSVGLANNTTNCPTGLTCQDATVTVTSTTLTSVSSTVTLLLVNY